VSGRGSEKWKKWKNGEELMKMAKSAYNKIINLFVYN
jgi:hypothetical protein